MNYIKVTGTRTTWRRVEIRNMHNCTGTARCTLRTNVNDVTIRAAYATLTIAVCCLVPVVGQIYSNEI